MGGGCSSREGGGETTEAVAEAEAVAAVAGGAEALRTAVSPAGAGRPSHGAWRRPSSSPLLSRCVSARRQRMARAATAVDASTTPVGAAAAAVGALPPLARVHRVRLGACGCDRHRCPGCPAWVRARRDTRGCCRRRRPCRCRRVRLGTRRSWADGKRCPPVTQRPAAARCRRLRVAGGGCEMGLPSAVAATVAAAAAAAARRPPAAALLTEAAGTPGAAGLPRLFPCGCSLTVSPGASFAHRPSHPRGVLIDCVTQASRCCPSQQGHLVARLRIVAAGCEPHGRLRVGKTARVSAAAPKTPPARGFR